MATMLATVARLWTLDGERRPCSTAPSTSRIEQPRLWWTHDLGEPALYDLTVDAAATATPSSTGTRQQVGIRTLALDQSPDPDEPGTRFFRFVLNGVPIFAKGANWIPCDSFVGAIPPEQYTSLLEAARDANMTMLRVWGGGIYEHDHFYDECDRLGLLVWQDFMFACAMYPEDDPAFAAEVEAEARYQVRRLRSHPSLALWCGNNENQWIHEMRYWDQPELPAYGALFYDDDPAAGRGRARRPHAVLAGQPVRRQRPQQHATMATATTGTSGTASTRATSASEPRREFTPESVTYLRYAEDRGRFSSEFGMHAAPACETLRRVIPEDQRYHHSPSLDWHNKDNPKNKGDMLMLVDHRRARRPGRVHRLQPDRPGRGPEVRHRALPPPHAALLGHAGLAAQRLLAGAELERARLLRLRQGRATTT